MIRFSPGPERYKLGFIEAVKSAFAFLEEEHGFRSVRAESHTFVRYESEKTFVQIFHGRGSYELGVEVGLISPENNDVECHYTLQEILQLFPDSGEDLPNYQVTNKESVTKFVRKLAYLLKKYGEEVLLGKPEVYDRLDNIKSENFRKMQVRWIRRDVGKAWMKRDFSEVVRLLESIKNDLIPSEYKKLEYSKKKIDKSG